MSYGDQLSLIDWWEYQGNWPFIPTVIPVILRGTICPADVVEWLSDWKMDGTRYGVSNATLWQQETIGKPIVTAGRYAAVVHVPWAVNVAVGWDTIVYQGVLTLSCVVNGVEVGSVDIEFISNIRGHLDAGEYPLDSLMPACVPVKLLGDICSPDEVIWDTTWDPTPHRIRESLPEWDMSRDTDFPPHFFGYGDLGVLYFDYTRMWGDDVPLLAIRSGVATITASSKDASNTVEVNIYGSDH